MRLSPPSSEKRFWPDVFRMQIPLEPLRGSQLPQNALLLVGGESMEHPFGLKAILQPEPLVAVRDMRKFRADGLAIDEFQRAQDILELGARGNGRTAAVGEEFGFQVRIRQAEVLQIEHIRPRPFLQTERVEIGGQVAAIRIHLDQARHRALLGARHIHRDLSGARHIHCNLPGARHIGRTRRRACTDRRLRCGAAARGGPFASLAARNFLARLALQALEVRGPRRPHRPGVLQECPIEIFDEIGVSARQGRGGQLVCR